jgi:hypothetical protein
MKIQTSCFLCFASWLFRLVWNRRVGWTLVTLISLLVLYYQWENRRSARELVEARAQMIALIGTDYVSEIIPPQLTDETNFFALPAIAAWKTDATHHLIPENAFWPENLPKPELIETDDGNGSHVNWSKWAANRDLKGGTPAQALHRELGDAQSLLLELAAGLDRPFSCLKPTQRDVLEAANGEFISMAIPNIPGLNDRHRELALRLRAAAHAGDTAQAQTLARIVLRLFPESSASHGTLVGSLVSIATHQISFEALQDALACPVWDERGLTLLQAQLAKENDLVVTRRAFTLEMLWGHAQLSRHRGNVVRWQLTPFLKMLYDEPNWTAMWVILGPVGWQDADAAQHLRYWCEIIGPEDELAWTQTSAVTKRIEREVRQELYLVQDMIPNPRRFLGSVLIPNLGNVYASAAETLFRRRCLILACELEKHRLRHGVYPAALPMLSGFETHDPARPKQPLGYRLQKDGYVLTSAHEGWLWRMKRTP